MTIDLVLRAARLACAAATLLLACAPAIVRAQETFPSRPIELIVPWGPGGGSDITGRMVAKYLEAELKVPVPVVNPGPLSYKLIETFLALGLTHGRAAYPAPVEPRLDMLHRMMRAGARAETGAAG